MSKVGEREARLCSMGVLDIHIQSQLASLFCQIVRLPRLVFNRRAGTLFLCDRGRLPDFGVGGGCNSRNYHD